MNDFAKMAVPSLFGALVGSLIVPLFNLVASERQVDLKKLELSIGILREAPKKDSDPLRAWALSVLEKQSGQTFTQAQRDALLKVPSSK
jgi:hypothetical protein